MRPRKRTLALLAGLMLLIWSAAFASTYRYAFFWDDYHCIRPYSSQELLSTFHGWDDPDKVETPALRPVAALLFAFQGSAFGENVVAHRIFLTGLMWTLLFTLGLVLAELELSTFQIGVVFALFVFSRVFATLNLWIIQGSLVFSYTMLVIAVLFFILWLKNGRLPHLLLMLLSALVAVFAREETYILPVALLVIWALLPRYRNFWRRALIAATCVLGITATHFFLRLIFVPEAPGPKFTWDALEAVWLCIKSSWLPCGYKTIGFADGLLANLWIGFLVLLLILFVRVANPLKLWQTAAVCSLGILAASPAIAVAHSYGLALPALAFRVAVAIAIVEIYRQMQLMGWLNKTRQYALVSFLALGLMIGIGGGLRRSMYVAESLHDNCALKVLFDANFLFDLYGRQVTVPEKRKDAARSELARSGIFTIEDIQRVYSKCAQYDPEYVQNRRSRTNLFLPKYEFASY